MGMLSFLILVVIIILLDDEGGFLSLKKKSVPPETPNIKFTHDRQDPTGYERHDGVGFMKRDILIEKLRKEGFCEERITRFIKDHKFIMSYEPFLI